MSYAKKIDGVWIMQSHPVYRKAVRDGNAREPRTKAEPVSLECRHRSKDFTLVGCRTCRGNVQVKVFQCDKFGECSIGGRAGKNCETCGEREA